jgi:hypothetical protein
LVTGNLKPLIGGGVLQTNRAGVAQADGLVLHDDLARRLEDELAGNGGAAGAFDRGILKLQREGAGDGVGGCIDTAGSAEVEIIPEERDQVGGR